MRFQAECTHFTIEEDLWLKILVGRLHSCFKNHRLLGNAYWRIQFQWLWPHSHWALHRSVQKELDFRRNKTSKTLYSSHWSSSHSFRRCFMRSPVPERSMLYQTIEKLQFLTEKGLQYIINGNCIDGILRPQSFQSLTSMSHSWAFLLTLA